MLEFVHFWLYFVYDENNLIDPLLQVGSDGPKINGSDLIRILISEFNKHVNDIPGKVTVALGVVAMVELKYRSPGGQEQQVGQSGPVHTDQDIRGAYHLQLLGERGPVVGNVCQKSKILFPFNQAQAMHIG